MIFVSEAFSYNEIPSFHFATVRTVYSWIVNARLLIFLLEADP